MDKVNEETKEQSEKNNQQLANSPLVFRISKTSNVVKTSDAISNSILEGKRIELRAIGGGAISQAVKAIATAKGRLAPAAINLVTDIGFGMVTIEGAGEKTMMVFKLIKFELGG